MATPNASPITGSELIRIQQDGVDKLVNRTQMATLVAVNGLINRRFRGTLTERTGGEMVVANQGGQRIGLSMADLTTFLAATGPLGVAPIAMQPEAFTGRERVYVDQGAIITVDLSQLAYLRGAGGALGGYGDYDPAPGTGGGVTPTLLPLDSLIAMEGDSITASMSVGIGLALTVQALSGARMRQGIGWMRAVSGRLLSAMASETANVLTSKPAVIHLLGGTNDLAQAAATYPLSRIQGDLDTCLSAYLAASTTKFVIVSTVAPRFGANALTTAREADRVAFNAYIRSKASATIKVVDMEAIGLTEADTADGLHFLWSGSTKMANAINAVLDTLVTPGNALAKYNTAANFLGADAMPGTAGTRQPASATMSGEVATGWNVQSAADAGLTIVLSKHVVDGVEGQRMRVTGTSTASPTINIQKSVTVNTIAGQTVELFTGMKVNGPSTGLVIAVMNGGNPVQGFGRSGSTRGDFPVGTYTLRSGENIQGGTGAATTVFDQIEVKPVNGVCDFDVTFFKPIVIVSPATPLS